MTRALPNKRRLTEGFVRKPGPKQETSFLVWGEYTRGLTVRVEPTGAKSWMVYYRSSGKPRWYRIGSASSIELPENRHLVLAAHGDRSGRHTDRALGSRDDAIRTLR